MTALSNEVHEVAGYEFATGYATGYVDALTAVAERADALDRGWAPVWRRTPEDVIRERIAEMERLAQRLAGHLLDRYGRVPWQYCGGPVDYETGRPR